MYTYGKHADIVVTGEDATFVYLKFRESELKVTKAGYIAYRKTIKDEWVQVNWHDNGSGQMRTNLYNGDKRYTLARSRVHCVIAHGNPTPDKPFVKHIDGNTMNDDVNNLMWADALHASRRSMSTEENIEAISKIPEGQRNFRNPEYMKLYNSLKGKDGLNHADRFRFKMKEAGLARRVRIIDGVKKSVWVPIDSVGVPRGRPKKEEPKSAE